MPFDNRRRGGGNITTPTTTVNNTLTSTSTTEALSAAMGNVLYNKTFDPSVKPTLSSDFKNDRHEVYENNRFVSKTVENTWSVTRSTTGTYVDPTGIIRTAAINVPRYTFENGVPKGLLIEEARTNLRLNSQNLQASIGTTVVVDTHTAPDGTLTMDSLYETATTGAHYAADTNIIPTADFYYTWSCFARSGSTDRKLLLRVAGGNIAGVMFDLSTRVATVISDANLTSYSFTPIGDGIYRCSVTMLAANASNTVFRLQMTNGTTISYTGDTTKFIPIWGAQLEVSSTPSSYIPTTTAQVTRTADSVVRTLAAEFNPSEFTVFYDGGLGTGSYPSIFSIRNESDTDSVQVRRNAATNANLSTNYSLLVVINDVVTSVAVGNTLKKAAVTYKNGVTKLYVDGQYKTQIEGVLNSNLFTQLVTSPKESVSSIKVYPSALTDAECVALTAI